MSKEINIEQIDLYLTDQLSAGERSQFEELIQQDPLLKEELRFQEEIIQSVKTNRAAQLKARLDNIQLPGPGIGEGAVGSLKVAGPILAIAAAGLGTYFYLQEPAVPETTPPTEQITQITEEVKNPVMDQQIESMPITEGQKEAVETVPVPEAKEPVAKTAGEIVAQEPEVAPEAPSERVQPNLIDISGDDDLGNAEEMVDLPTLPVEAEELNEVLEMSVKKIKDGKHNFHYQNYNDKLYLYGDFHNVPYEILDLAGAESRKLYLYYQDKFYRIKPDQTEISALEVIADQDLVNELAALRDSKNR